MSKPLTFVVGLLSALGLLAFMALFTYAAYRHWSLPVGSRSHDVWGTMCVVAVVGGLFTGSALATALEASGE